MLGLVTVMTMGSRLARSSALGSWLRATGAKHVARLARSSSRGRESSRTSISTMAHNMSDKINLSHPPSPRGEGWESKREGEEGGGASLGWGFGVRGSPKMEPGRGYYHVMIAPNRFRQGVVSGATLPSACLSPKRTFGREAPLVSVAKRTTPGVYQHPLPY